MKVALIGPELEENLGLRYLHAALAKAGIPAEIFDFHAAGQIASLTRNVLAWAPDVVGLSMVFTGRARQYVALADKLRSEGFAGHVTAGGHFASFHAARLLRDHGAIDSIVHGEGEETLVDLVRCLDNPAGVAGLSFRDDLGEIVTTPLRRIRDDLDARPFPTRPSRFHRYLGLPIANMLASRGCYGHCSYCSISAWFRQNPGRRFRQRSTGNIADELAGLYHDRGVRIFNFHDDNFFHPSEEKNLDRFRALGRELESRGVHRIALQVKARPDSVRPESMAVLRDMGLFRVFLGVESNADAGLKTLGRAAQKDHNHRALELLGRLGIHTSFNLLMFDPETTPEDLADNIAFMRRYAGFPMNFGRVEVYSGTPLERRLRKQNRLLGSHFGHSYRITDERVQCAFEIYKKVFLPRNFEDDGNTLRSMKLDYYVHLLRHFRPEIPAAALERRAGARIRRLNLNSAVLLERIRRFVVRRRPPSDMETARFALALASERERFDVDAEKKMEALIEEVRDLAAGRRPGRSSRPVAYAASAAAVALVISVGGCRKARDAEKPDDGPAPTEAVMDADDGAGHVRTGDADVIPELSGDQVEAVKQHIADAYQDEFNRLALEHRFTDKEVRMEITLDDAGKVTDVDIELPGGEDMRAFESALKTQVLGWTFPSVKQKGLCVVGLKLVEPEEPAEPQEPPPVPPEKKPKKKKKKPKEPDWHMCEYMMSPMNEE